jgi:hypothetical protein
MTNSANHFLLRFVHLNQVMKIINIPHEVKFTLNTSVSLAIVKLAIAINSDENIAIVMMQHEFGFFMKQENAFTEFLAPDCKTNSIGFSYHIAPS